MARVAFPDDADYVGSEEVDGGFKPASLGDVAISSIAYMANCHSLATKTESPIETSFGGALMVFLGGEYVLQQQFRIGRYRYDFAVVRHGRAKPVALIECDSVKFHQTPKQLANDRIKDAAAANVGLPVIRVRGPAIWRDPFKTARFALERLP